MKSTKAAMGPILMVIPMMIPMQSNNGNQLQNQLIGTDIGVNWVQYPSASE